MRSPAPQALRTLHQDSPRIYHLVRAEPRYSNELLNRLPETQRSINWLMHTARFVCDQTFPIGNTPCSPHVLRPAMIAAASYDPSASPTMDSDGNAIPTIVVVDVPSPPHSCPSDSDDDMGLNPPSVTPP